MSVVEISNRMAEVRQMAEADIKQVTAAIAIELQTRVVRSVQERSPSSGVAVRYGPLRVVNPAARGFPPNSLAMSGHLEAFDDGLRDFLLQDGGIGALVGSRVYVDMAPAGAAFPYLVLSLQSWRDDERSGGGRVEICYNVRAVVDADASGSRLAAQIASVVRARLDDSQPVIEGWGVSFCWHETAYRYIEMVEKRAYASAGGVYRLAALALETE